MTDREILAGLKISYEKLYDIRENGCIDHCNGQLKNELIKKLEIAQSNIEEIYSNFYKTVDKEILQVESLEKEVKVYISSDISNDYEINDYMLSCDDINYYWYENQDFLNEKYKNVNNRYYIKIWMTESDRNQGISQEYYKYFDNLEEAIKDIRTYFYDGNCECAEVYDKNDKSYYLCDKESEDFYIDGKISFVDKETVDEYINNYSNNAKQTFNGNKLYCFNDNKYIAINNESGNCWVEKFDSEKATLNWLLDRDLRKELNEDEICR